MSTQAKFMTTQKTELINGYQVQLNATYSDSEEDQTFWKYTPSAEIRLSLVQPETAAQFKVGKLYYVSFTEAGDE